MQSNVVKVVEVDIVLTEKEIESVVIDNENNCLSGNNKKTIDDCCSFLKRLYFKKIIYSSSLSSLQYNIKRVIYLKGNNF
jgi:hypothetical protein